MLMGFWSVLIAALSYGMLSTGVAICYGYGAGLGDVVAAQVLVGWMFLAVFGLRGFVRSVRAGVFSTKDLVYGLVLGAATTLIGFCYYRAVQIVGVAWSVLLLFQYPWVVLALDCARSLRWPLTREIGVLGVVLFGTILASGANLRQLDFGGMMWGLLAASFYGLFLYGNTRIRAQATPLSKGFWVQTGGLLSWLMIAVLGYSWIPDLGIRVDFWLGADWNVIALALGLGIFGCVLPPWLMAKGMPLVGVFWGSLISAVELPLAMLLGYGLLGEKMSLWMWLGGLLVAFAPVFPWIWDRLLGVKSAGLES